jgi:glycosyltransferase involved in cell wall biosynthesis
MNILVITTLFPNKIEQRHGIFVETRLKHLMNTGAINARVIAPVPWFPFNKKIFGKYAKYSQIPRCEIRHDVHIYHPRYLVIPKIGMLFTPFFLAISILLKIRELQKTGYSYDLIDGHFYYPDGVAIALIAKKVKKPFFVTARGSDINLYTNLFMPRKMILWAANKAVATITVCNALRDQMIEIGVDASKVFTFRNGVDLEMFRMIDRDVCRKKYKVNSNVLICVGNLVKLKGQSLIIKAMLELPDYELLIIGEGEDESKLKAQIDHLDLVTQVKLLGGKQQKELIELYNCADALLLASSREGWANVLLESMACGTPVVATKVGGNSEVVKSDKAGVLIRERTSESIAMGVHKLFSNYPKRKETREYAEQFSWDETVVGLIDLYQKNIIK